jgi:hypothetical protein
VGCTKITRLTYVLVRGAYAGGVFVMFILGIFFIFIGVLFIINPSFIWLITESWKSDDGTEPSILYIWNTRFDGLILLIVGFGSVITAYL